MIGVGGGLKEGDGSVLHHPPFPPTPFARARGINPVVVETVKFPTVCNCNVDLYHCDDGKPFSLILN